MLFSRVSLALALLAAPLAATASDLEPRTGWEVYNSTKPYKTLIKDLGTAVKDQGLIVVTQAGPTGAAAARGITIPGNRIMGVFNNDYAVKVLALSTAAMIEAPIRFYVTENADGSATLSYKTPGYVFAPYLDEGGESLQKIADELTVKFGKIAEIAID